MRVLLDTQAFIYAIDENQHHKLPSRARRALLEPENTRELSAASVSEIALKAARHRLGITEEQLSPRLEAAQRRHPARKTGTRAEVVSVALAATAIRSTVSSSRPPSSKTCPSLAAIAYSSGIRE